MSLIWRYEGRAVIKDEQHYSYIFIPCHGRYCSSTIGTPCASVITLGPRLLFTAMVGQHHLPEELLQKILWQLKLSTDSHYNVKDENHVLSKTLASCLLASRTLYRLAKPVLYHTINTDKLLTITHHFAQDPSLADQVRELSVDERGCHKRVQVMDEDDDRQWPEYLRSRLSAHSSLLTDPRDPDDSSTYGYSMPVATLALIVCTKIHTLVLHGVQNAPQALPDAFMMECLALGHARPDCPDVPLLSLRKFNLERPSAPEGPEWDEDGDGEGEHWFSCFLRLPRIASIEMCDIFYDSKYTHSPSSSLKSLVLTEMEELPASKLEDILKACPMLEILDASWMIMYNSSPIIEWAALGTVLSRHGSRLRKVKLNSSGIRLPSAEPSTLINLSSLTHLRSLSVPVEAVLTEPAGNYSVPADEDDHNIDMSDGPGDDEGMEDEDDFRNSHAPGQGLNTPTVSLYQLLPQSLRRLKIIDDWNLWADAVRLDMELHDLMLHPHFSELRSIRVRRKIPYSKHVEDLGWRNKRRQHYWRVLLRS